MTRPSLWPLPPPAASQQGYLDRLGKGLVPRLSAPQVQEVLSDYQERFGAGRDQGRSDAELIRALGAPREAAARILEETPPSGLLRYYLSRGALLVLCLEFFRLFVLVPYPEILTWPCGCLFLPMIAGVLFSLLRGGARLELENQFPPERTAPRKALFAIPLAVAVVFKAGHQLWTAAVFRDPAGMVWTILPMRAGELNQLLCIGLALAMALLALWWLVRCVTVSIRYFPGVIHALGLAVAGWTTLTPFLSVQASFTNTLRGLSLTLLLYFLPYLAGLATALAFQRWLDNGLPACFRPLEGGQRTYLDALGKCLLRWFPAGQVREILADYREQFELGLERGKSEAALAEELGRPEAAARDLLAAEDPLLRRSARRRDILWTVLLLPAAWVLVGMFLQFEYGQVWLLWPGLAPVFLALGSAAVFALLRGPGRAEIEGQFPPEQGEAPVWASLLPAAVMVLTAVGFGYILMCKSWYEDGGITPAAMTAICFIELSVLLLSVLLVWTLSRSSSRSIRYFPAAVQAAGAAMGCLKTGTTVRHLYLDAPLPFGAFIRYILEAFFPYLISLALAAAFAVVIRAFIRRGKAG